MRAKKAKTLRRVCRATWDTMPELREKFADSFQRYYRRVKRTLGRKHIPLATIIQAGVQ